MKKKILLLISMLAVSFAFTGCGNDTELFDYDEQEVADFCVYIDAEYMSIASDELQYNYLIESGVSLGIATEEEIAVLEVLHDMADNYGEFLNFGETYEIEEYDDSIIVSIDAVCEDADVVIKSTVVDNSAQYEYLTKYYADSYGISEDEAASILKENGIYPYTISECEVSEDSSTGELLKSAGVNTLIGMVTVFVVLIFIAFIISLLKYAPMLVESFSKEAREAKKAARSEASDTPEDTETKTETVSEEETVTNNIVSITDAGTGESVMDNGELVAVIAAAVNAYSADGQPAYVNYPSNDKLIVRSRRRR